MAERSSDQIQRDIERTRADMSETIDALERRLSPGELFDEFWGRIKSGDTGANVGETIRDHPVPLALMGLGLGWLAIEKSTESRTGKLRSHHDHVGEGTYARADGRVGPYRGDDIIDGEHRYDDSGSMGSRVSEKAGSLKDQVTGMGGEVKDRLSSATDSAREKVSQAGDRMRSGGDGRGPQGDGGPSMSDRAHQLRGRADNQMHHARESMQRRGSQLERGFRSLLEDYPLALGAVTFGLGLAAGASAPTTEMEDEMMGDAADTLKDEVKETARETGERARHVASEAADAARSEADDQQMGDDLRAKAEQVVSAAASTAKEEARSQGLTSEEMKNRAREVGQKTTETARHQGAHSDSPSSRPPSGPAGPANSPGTATPSESRPGSGGLFDDRSGDRIDSR